MAQSQLFEIELWKRKIYCAKSNKLWLKLLEVVTFVKVFESNDTNSFHYSKQLNVNYYTLQMPVYTLPLFVYDQQSKS